jgi:hypothetical protein
LDFYYSKNCKFIFCLCWVGHMWSYLALKICTDKHQGNIYMHELFRIFLKLYNSIAYIFKRMRLHQCLPNTGHALISPIFPIVSGELKNLFWLVVTRSSCNMDMDGHIPERSVKALYGVFQILNTYYFYKSNHVNFW